MKWRPRGMNGKIVVYTGPMFSSKSVMMFFAHERGMIAEKKVLAFKPVRDNRFGNTVIKSRSYDQTIEANNISDISELLDYDADVYIIDEFQFLEGDISIIQDMANVGKVFHISGLDMTAEGKPFGLMPELLAIADQVNKQVAVCNDCKQENATLSFFLGKKTEDVLVGDKEYIPLCRACWKKRMKMKENGVI